MKYRKFLISAGVKQLKGYGYPRVNAYNILADEVYRAYFRSMLSGTVGKYGTACDRDIEQLFGEIEALEAKAIQ